MEEVGGVGFGVAERLLDTSAVMGRLADTEFLEQLGPERVFLTTEQAYDQFADEDGVG